MSRPPLVRRLLVVVPLVVALAAAGSGGDTRAPSAHAATGSFSCLPANGLMNLNDPDQLMAGKVVLANGVKVDIGTSGDVDWARTTLAADSARWLYSLKWLESLTRQYRRTGTQAYLDRAVAIARDFAADNPPGRGPDPVDSWYPMYAGQRTTVYACLDDMTSDPAIRAALGSHAEWLAAPANDPGDWNQGIDPALGLLGGGCRLDRADWRKLASDRFARMIRANVDPEGAINEQAPGYVRFIYERWGLVASKLAECGQAVPGEIAARRPLMLDFLAWSTSPDGKLVQLGDTYLDAPLSVPGTATEYVATAGKKGTAPTGLYRIYSAGFVFGRDRWAPFAGGMHYSLRFGPGMAFHGHEDHQSVTLSAHGRRVLVDSGHVGYTAPAKRDHLRSPEAHNVLVVPGEGLRRRRPTELRRSDAGDGWQFFEVQDDVWNGHLRRRGVLADTAAQTLLVQDRATRTSSGRFDQLWHLPRGSSVTINGRSTAVARDPSGALETHIIQLPLPGQDLPKGATSVVSGQASPLLGWVAPSLNAWHAAPVVRTSRVGTSAHMVTAIVPVEPGTPVTAAATASGSGWQITVKAGATTRSYGISSGGGMWVVGAGGGADTSTPPYGAVRLNGDWNGDGTSTPGWFKDGHWGMYDRQSAGGETTRLSYGQAGDRPVVGDWDGDGTDTVGVVRGNQWILRNEYRRGADDIVMNYGLSSDRPVVGDWDGNGTDTLGVVRGDQWILRNEYRRGADDTVFRY